MNQVLPYCVYVLLSEKDGMFYIGYTTDIDRRYKEHNDGKSKSTAPRRPFQLIFCEFYVSETDAKRRELYFKTTAGRRALKIMLRESLAK
jgi:putative endonuclease